MYNDKIFLILPSCPFYHCCHSFNLYIKVYIHTYATMHILYTVYILLFLWLWIKYCVWLKKEILYFLSSIYGLVIFLFEKEWMQICAPYHFISVEVLLCVSCDASTLTIIFLSFYLYELLFIFPGIIPLIIV